MSAEVSLFDRIEDPRNARLAKDAHDELRRNLLPQLKRELAIYGGPHNAAETIIFWIDRVQCQGEIPGSALDLPALERVYRALSVLYLSALIFTPTGLHQEEDGPLADFEISQAAKSVNAAVARRVQGLVGTLALLVWDMDGAHRIQSAIAKEKADFRAISRSLALKLCMGEGPMI